MTTEHLEVEKVETSTKGYSPMGEESKVWEEYRRRKQELLLSRQNVQGKNIDAAMRQWDKNYFNREADIPASELDPDQKPISINNSFGKIQAALAILIDRNPNIILTDNKKKYSANKELIRSLANSSWKNTNSLGQFKLSVFNMAKRGWFAGRTFNRKLIHDARFLKSDDGKGGRAYETRSITKLDDIAYMNLDNHNVWFDEEARPDDMFSVRDAMHREVWSFDEVRRVFPEADFPNMQFVKEGGNVAERIEGSTTDSKNSGGVSSQKEVKKGMTELFFYEHQFKDWFIIEINGVMVVWEPLPQNHKRLSYVAGYWNLRSAETIYGIGLIEEMERDETLIDRILNMSMRQLLISINPPGFYTGTEDLENENLKIKAGVIRKVLDPKSITWLQIPEMKKVGLEVIDWLEKKEEQRTGITKLLEGEVGGNNTAFEVGVNRESSLKRLRLPLRSLQGALDWEYRNRIDLIKQTYSDFQVEHLADEDAIMEYLEEVKADPDYYYIENEGQVGKEKFFVKKFRESNLNIQQDEKGNFIEADKNSFFKIKPEFLSWEGDTTVDINSILIQSEELEKADTLRFTNLLVPLFVQPKEIALKPAKQLTIAFNKDPKKWLPDAWLQEPEGEDQGEKTQIPAEVQAMMNNNKPPEMKTPTIVPPNQVANPSLGQRLSSAFSAFKQPGQ